MANKVFLFLHHDIPALLLHRPQMEVTSSSTVFLRLLSAAILLSELSLSSDVGSDTTALLLFRNQTDLHGTLLSNWTTNASACAANWLGVACGNNRVIAVSLEFLNLRGPIDALSSLDQLIVLDLPGNRLDGSLAPIAQCVNLERVNLSGNDFSGEIPSEFSSLSRIASLDLSDNNLRGSIPAQFSNLLTLRSLRLQNNKLSGIIPTFLDWLPHLRRLNLSNNEFYGSLPYTLASRFGLTSFSGNQGLCGFSPFPNCSFSPSPTNTSIETPPIQHHIKLSTKDIIAITVVNSFLFLVMVFFPVWYCCRKRFRETNSARGNNSSENINANEVSGSVGNNANNEIIFFDKSKQFGVVDLLQAPAEMIGKGYLGAVYKAVLENGFIVAVKRIKDTNPCANKDFEMFIHVIGKLSHRNLTRLIGYYDAREEKLLLYDYMANGNLHSLLHASERLGRVALDWTTRICLILGAARGLSRIHSRAKIPHGNMKTSNVLIDRYGIACISDFGLAFLIHPTQVISTLGGYKAPEQYKIKKLSLKADVYSFGVIMLEMLTGMSPANNPTADLPRWVQTVPSDRWIGEVFDPELSRYPNMEGEMVMMMRVAMACVAPLPMSRPRMEEVVAMIEDIRVEESPGSESLGGSDYTPTPGTT